MSLVRPVQNSRSRRIAGLLAAVLASVGLVAVAAAPANAAITPVPSTQSGGALAIANSMAAAGTTINSASFVTVLATTSGNAPNGTSNAAIAGFPGTGSNFGILTTGRAAAVPVTTTTDELYDNSPSIFPASGRGNSPRDTTVLKVDLTAPAGVNCLSFDFKFLSEEYPRYVGQGYNDAFIAELDSTTWTANGNATTATITAPNNFAKDTSGGVVSVNSTGLGGMSSPNGVGTRFSKVGSSADTDDGGATGLLRANVQVTPGNHSLYLSIFDMGDPYYDSAVFVNNLRTSFRPNPSLNCVAGAQPVNTSMTLTPPTSSKPVGTTHTVTATLKDSNNAAIPNAPVNFNVTGANTLNGSGTTNNQGIATYTYTGTNPGNDIISACYQPSTTCLANASATATWNAPVVITANPQSKVYGSADPAFTYTVSGLGTGETLTTNPTCTVSGAHSNVGSYPITCTGAAAANRTVTYVPGTLSVTPKTVTVIADNQVKTYGSADPAFTYTVSGLESGDSLTTTPTCDVTGAHSNVGSYPIICTGAAATSNYDVAYQNGSLTVGKKLVTIKADSQSKNFGQADPAFTYTVSGLEPGDSLTTNPTCSVTGVHNNAGSYPITCTGASAGTPSNYAFAYTDGTLTVAKATVTVTADPQPKVYGSADPEFTFTVAGLAGGDQLTAEPTCTVTGPHNNAGSYPITCTGADAGSNYDVTYTNGTLTVTKATVTVIADNKTKVYGTADPAFTYDTTGLVGNDQLTTDPTCEVTDAHHDVGNYPITCSGASAGGNYRVEYVAGILHVTKATVTITADPKSKVYGTADPAFTWTVSGLADEGDHLISEPTCAVSGAHSNVGSYPITCTGGDAGPNYDVAHVAANLTVTEATVSVVPGDQGKIYGDQDPSFDFIVQGLVGDDQLLAAPTCSVPVPHHNIGYYEITCSGADAGPNYNVEYGIAHLQVVQRIVTVTPDNKTKVYGTPDPAFTYSIDGFVGSDGLLTEPDCGPRVDHSQVGTYPILCTDADAGPNYFVNYVQGELTVTPASIVITADSKTVTYGDDDPDFGWSASGVLESGGLVSGPTCGVEGPHKNVGSYPITCSGAVASGNYEITYVDGTLNVQPKAITVAADNKSIVFGSPDPAFTSTANGLVGDDELTTDATCDVAGPHSNVGSYDIVCSGADAGDNYTIGYAPGTLTVTKKAGVVVADDQQITFGDSDPEFTYTVSGLNGSDGLAEPATCTVTGAHSNVGTYPITCSGGTAGGNYELSYQAGTLTVVPATVTVTADNKTKVYGTADPQFTYGVSGLLGNDQLTTDPTCDVAGAHSNVGSYPITCSGAAAGVNYEVTYLPGDLTVTKATATVTADNKTKVYGTADPWFTFQTTGLVGNDTLTTDPTCAVPGAHSNVGGYDIVCSGASAGGNYDIAYANGTLTVTKATLTVTADDKTKVQGNPLPTFTATITGYVNGDGAGAVSGAPSLTTTATATSPAGTYPITAGPGTLSSANYGFTFVPGTLTVTSQPPTATITTPPNGAVYFQGQAVKAQYSCADPDGTVVSCTGPVANGAAIDTATTGTKTFTVTATDNNGLTGTASTSYKVVPVVGECRATPLGVLGILVNDVNPAGTPCVTKKQQALNAGIIISPALLILPAQGVFVNAVTGETTNAVGATKATSEIAGATITLAGLTIKVNALTSAASSQLTNCQTGATLTGSSKITGLTVNGIPLIPADGLSTPLTLPLGVGTIALNEKTVSGNKITQTALRINLAGVEVVLGRSIAGTACGS